MTAAEMTPTHPPGDPTTRTVEMVHREVTTLTADTSKQFESERRLTSEQFAAVELQFNLVERFRVAQKEDTKAAVDAALTAQKEAVKEQTTASDRAIAKSETAMTKQLEQLIVTFTTATNGLAGKIDDVKSQVGEDRANRRGGKEAVAAIYGFIGFLSSLVVLGGILLATR